MPKKDPRLVELSKYVKDYLSKEDTEMFSDQFLDILSDEINTLSDSRQKSKIKHSLNDCVGIVLFSSFAGIDEWIEMELFAEDHYDDLRGYLALTNGIPSHDTLERVFTIIKHDELQTILVRILKETIKKACANGNVYENSELDLYFDDIISIDGKETCKSGNPNKKDIKDQRNFNVLNVQSTETGITLSTIKIDEKTNEIPEAQAVLKTLDLSKCIVTTDALNTQKSTVDAIINDAKGDYCLAVKGNQKTLFEDLVLYFSDEEFLDAIKKNKLGYLIVTEEDRTRIITWEHFITDDIEWYEDREKWNSLKSFGYVKKTIYDKNKDKQNIEERYYICSFKPVAQLFSLVIRRHWHVEVLHWMLDVVFKEDSLRTKEKKALHNLGLINRFVLSILKILKPYYNNISYQHIRRKIDRNFKKEIPVVFAVIKKLYSDEILIK